MKERRKARKQAASEKEKSLRLFVRVEYPNKKQNGYDIILSTQKLTDLRDNYPGCEAVVIISTLLA